MILAPFRASDELRRAVIRYVLTKVYPWAKLSELLNHANDQVRQETIEWLEQEIQEQMDQLHKGWRPPLPSRSATDK